MKYTLSLGLTLLLTITVPPAGATPVFTWVDDTGVTHFSETPPTDDTAGARLIDIEDTESPDTFRGGDDFYSVINQAERMETRRLENEKLAAEKQQAKAEARKARAEAAAIQQGAGNYNDPDNTRYYPVYSYYPRYGHYPGKPSHGHKPGPEHPVYRGRTRPKNPRTSLGKTPGMPR